MHSPIGEMRALFTVERHCGRGDYEDPDRRQAPEHERPPPTFLSMLARTPQPNANIAADN